jgi:endonuclease/exonuclease/phosphatase family metal-dependent hydrolase
VTPRRSGAVGALRVVTWNIHGCVGTDRRYDPERVAEVLRLLDADVVGLQEVDTRRPNHRGRDQLDFLAEHAGYDPIAGPNIVEHKGHYGNAVLTRLPVRRDDRIDLAVPQREPRGALDVEVDGPQGPVRIVVTHLGLASRERHDQVERLVSAIGPRPVEFEPTLLLGDFNEWPLGGGARLRRLLHRFEGHYVARTFPSPLPVLPLDRIYVHPLPAWADHHVAKTRLTARASDHLPLVVDLAWERPWAGAKDTAA